jgi:hypothetical protein
MSLALDAVHKMIEGSDSLKSATQRFFTARKENSDEALEFLKTHQRFLKKLADTRKLKESIDNHRKEYVDSATVAAYRDAELRYQKSNMLQTETEWSDVIQSRLEEIQLARNQLQAILSNYVLERKQTMALQQKINQQTEHDRMQALNAVAFCTYAQTIAENEIKKLCTISDLPNERILYRIQNILRHKLRKARKHCQEYHQQLISEFKRQERILLGRGRDAQEFQHLLRPTTESLNNSHTHHSHDNSNNSNNNNNINGYNNNNPSNNYNNNNSYASTNLHVPYNTLVDDLDAHQQLLLLQEQEQQYLLSPQHPPAGLDLPMDSLENRIAMKLFYMTAEQQGNFLLSGGNRVGSTVTNNNNNKSTAGSGSHTNSHGNGGGVGSSNVGMVHHSQNGPLHGNHNNNNQNQNHRSNKHHQTTTATNPTASTDHHGLTGGKHGHHYTAKPPSPKYLHSQTMPASNNNNNNNPVISSSSSSGPHRMHRLPVSQPTNITNTATTPTPPIANNGGGSITTTSNSVVGPTSQELQIVEQRLHRIFDMNRYTTASTPEYFKTHSLLDSYNTTIKNNSSNNSNSAKNSNNNDNNTKDKEQSNSGTNNNAATDNKTNRNAATTENYNNSSNQQNKKKKKKRKKHRKQDGFVGTSLLLQGTGTDEEDTQDEDDISLITDDFANKLLSSPNSTAPLSKEDRLTALFLLMSETKGKVKELLAIRDGLDESLVNQISTLFSVLISEKMVASVNVPPNNSALSTGSNIIGGSVTTASAAAAAHWRSLLYPHYHKIVKLSAQKKIKQLDCQQKEQDVRVLRDKILRLLHDQEK